MFQIDIVEKTQPRHPTHDNPTNYYGLFYKLLDIFLTLATIILLAFTNLIASVKFVFLLYPRSIVLLLFLYTSCYYLVDHDKLVELLDDPANTNAAVAFTSTTGKSKENFTAKLILTLYRAFFPSRVTKLES